MAAALLASLFAAPSAPAAPRALPNAGVTASPMGPGVPPGGGREVGNPPQYYDGLIRYSNIVNCPSIIFGSPYTEFGAGVYTGYYADPDDNNPGIGEEFYLHVVVYGLGNSCSGQRFVPGIQFPQGVSPSGPVHCANSLTPTPTPCGAGVDLVPSAYGPGQMLLSGDTPNARTWGLPPGRYWEFVFPVTSNQAHTSTQLQAHVKMLDGNSSPVLNPTANLYVFGATPQPAIFYDSPSTVAAPTLPPPFPPTPTTWGLYSLANVFTNGAPGTVELLFGTTNNPTTVRGTVPVTNAGTSWLIATDWFEGAGFPPLQPGTTYKWRAQFDPTGPGPTVVGGLQQFTVPTNELCEGQGVTVSLALGQQPTEGSDVILGTNNAESINGGGGNDVICGGNGNDVINGGLGDDLVNGGSGTDTVSYAGLTGPITLNLGTAGAQNTGAGNDALVSVENAVGSAQNDALTGSGGANAIDGGGGADTLNGGGAADTLVGGSGNDIMAGGPGTDTASYTGIKNRVVVTLSSTASQNTQGAGTDRISQVENLTGTAKNDQLTGNAGANRFDGGAGSDRCDGKGARDTQVRCETRISIP